MASDGARRGREGASVDPVDVAPRRRRKDAAEAEVGLSPAGDGRWALPGVELETWFVMRRYPAERRLAFRLWVAEQDAGRLTKRTPAAWDQQLRVFETAEVK